MSAVFSPGNAVRIPSWKTALLLVVGLLGVGIIVCNSAAAETNKPAQKRVVQRPRPGPGQFASHPPTASQRPITQQNLRLRLAPGNIQQPGSGQASVRPSFAPQTRNVPTTLASRPGAAGFGQRTGSNLAGRNAFGNRFAGSLANRRRGGNGAPPGTRLIDMRVMPLPPGTGLPPIGETRFRPNEIVMQFGQGVSPAEVSAAAQRFGLTIVSQQAVGALRRTVYTVRINGGQPVANVIGEINAAGLNTAVQPNYTYGLTEDLPSADLGDPAQYVVQKLRLGAAHQISEGGNVVIAVIDSRIDLSQPDFAGRIADTYDAGCGANAPPDAHGTGMAGAIVSHNELLGVAPDAKIMAICAFGGSGTPQATSANIIRGLDYAIEHGAKIVNMSFAGPQDPALAQELQVAREKGILVVAAAGNAGAQSPPLYPGADPNVMAVTATDEHDHLFNGANQGAYIAVAAPGVNVLVPAPNGGVQLTTGTSVASANVSGIAALLIAEDPSRTPEDIRSILVSTARHLGAAGTNPQFGAGLVDPLKALHAAPEVVEQTSDHAQ